MTVLIELGDYASYAAGILAVLFVIYYAAFTRFYEIPEGQNVMLFAILNAFGLGYVAFAAAIRRGPPPIPPGALWIKLILMTGFAVALAWRLWLVWKANREKRQKQRLARRTTQ